MKNVLEHVGIKNVNTQNNPKKRSFTDTASEETELKKKKKNQITWAEPWANLANTQRHLHTLKYTEIALTSSTEIGRITRLEKREEYVKLLKMLH